MPGELPRLVLRGVLSVLVLGAGLVLAQGALGRPDASPAFQRVVGGIGLGNAVDLSGDPGAYDLRLGCSTALTHDVLMTAEAWLVAPSERAVRR